MHGITVKDIENNKIMTKSETQMSIVCREISNKIGLAPTYVCGGNTMKYPSDKRLSPERFSTNYETRDEFEKDRDTILGYLFNMEYPPEDLVDKVAETVEELDLKPWE